MRNLFKNFRKSESGATLVEYGVALIVAILVGGTFVTALAKGTAANMDGACVSLTVSGGSDGTMCPG